MSQTRLGPLLASARSRLQIAALVVVALGSAVLWAALAPDAPPASEPLTTTQPKAMRLVVAAGQPAPGGGAFERFDVAAQPSQPRLMPTAASRSMRASCAPTPARASSSRRQLAS